MTESRQQANQATQEVPNIQEKVAAAEESINSITEELTLASDKAKEARDLAQQAQKEYAEKASEVLISITSTEKLPVLHEERLKRHPIGETFPCYNNQINARYYTTY